MPIFVLTHKSRDPLPRQGGTTYYFVTGGLEAALADARAAAGDKNVGIELTKTRSIDTPRATHLRFSVLT